jgi:hypothetical protein
LNAVEFAVTVAASGGLFLGLGLSSPAFFPQGSLNE